MKARVKATGEIVEVEKTVCYCATWVGHERIYDESELDFNLDQPWPEATISGWVCKERDGELLISSDKPIKRTVDDGTVAGSIDWTSRGLINTAIYSAFPSLTWQDDPIEVEITIKPKKQS